jgi:MFS transporter, DHA2 family, integral membrane protein
MALGLTIVAVGFGILTTLTPDTPYLVIAAAFTLLGAGMSITAAPATSEIMTSVPLSKAGVGSAVNDTTRELGGALGIALLGSIANTAYRSGIDLDRVQLPSGGRAAAGESIGAASAIAERLPGGGGDVMAQAASAFTNAFTLTNTVAVGIALAAAAAVLAVSRRTRREPVEDAAFEDYELELVPVGAGEMRE